MSFNLQEVAALLHVANESAKHGPTLSGIHNAVMDELKKIHDELTVKRVEKHKQEAADAAEKETARVATARVEEEQQEPLSVPTGKPVVDRMPGQPNPDVPANPLLAKRIADEEKEAERASVQSSTEPRSESELGGQPTGEVDRRGIS